jgi:hypothetical protein
MTPREKALTRAAARFDELAIKHTKEADEETDPERKKEKRDKAKHAQNLAARIRRSLKGRE